MTPQPLPQKLLVLGVDFGKRTSPTTIVATEHEDPPTEWDSFTYSWKPTRPEPTYTVRLAMRLPLFTEYRAITETIWRLAEKHAVGEIRLDATGVGQAILEILEQSRPLNCRTRLRPVTLTGGQQSTHETIPRSELFARTALACENGYVRVAQGVKGWPDLVAELLALGPDGERRRHSDDLAIGFALSLWRFPPGPRRPVGEQRERLL